jgi:hypothetical protein
VQVHCDEGIANHIGPEPCAGIREDVGEASAGVRASQPLSHDRKLIPGADPVCVPEGKTSERAIASARMTRRGRRTWHVRTLLRRLGPDLLKASQSLVPSAFEAGGHETVGGIDLLIAALGQGTLVFGTLDAHLPRAHHGLVALLELIDGG